MTLEYMLLLMVGINLVLLVFIVVLVVRILSNVTMREGATETDPDIKTISEGVASMLAEFLPKGGASISYRINNLLAAASSAADNAIAAKTTAEAAREMASRVDNNFGRIQESLNAIAIAQASQARAMNIILNSGHVGQAGAGEQFAQTSSTAPGVEIATAGLGQTKTGMNLIEKGIEQVKEGN